MSYQIISIEGNIGSGKTTLLKKLRETYSNNERFIFLKEPVDEWEKIVDKNGNTMLQKFYENQEKYSFAFQMMAYISRLKIVRDAIKTIEEKGINNSIIFTERSLYTDKYVFAKMLYDQGKIEDVCYNIYQNWFDEFAKDFPVNKTIYVKTDPEICYDRIHKRARHGEEVIPLNYLSECHNYHGNFLDNKKSDKQLLLNGNNDIFKDEKIMEQWLANIDRFL
jgi:deoxyguanosine kinase